MIAISASILADSTDYIWIQYTTAQYALSVVLRASDGVHSAVPRAPANAPGSNSDSKNRPDDGRGFSKTALVTG